MTKTEAVQVNLVYLIFKLVHFLVDTSDLLYIKVIDGTLLNIAKEG